MLCYAAAIAVRLSSPGGERSQLVRGLWTTGWLFLVAHVVLAIAWFHDGSWSEAYEHTAARTEEAVGWRWGGGVWLNLLTTIIWGIDVVRAWTIPLDAGRKAWWWDIGCHLYMAFMIFNATVVFGSRPAQVVGGLISLGLVLALVRRMKRRGSRV